MTITIEPLALNELKAFLRMQADVTFPGLKDESRLKMLAEKWHEHAEFCTCRDNENRLIGMIAFYANRPETGESYIAHVYVYNKYRGKKIFSKMFHLTKETVKENGFSQIRLEVGNDNVRALNAYLKIGFQQVGKASESSLYMRYIF